MKSKRNNHQPPHPPEPPPQPPQENTLRDLRDLVQLSLDVAEENKYLLREVLQELRWARTRPVIIHVAITGGNTLNPIGQQATVTVTEADAKGVNVPIVPANISYSIADPTVATLVANADGTATITAVAPGTTTITANDTVNNLTGSATVTVATPVVADVPTTLTVTVGDWTTSAPPTAAGTSKTGAQPV